MTTLTKALLVVIAVLGLGFGIQTWRVQAHENDAAEAAVRPAKDAAAVATAKVESVTVTLAGKIDTVTRRIHDTVTVPEHVQHPETPTDTAEAVRLLPIVVAERDSIAKSCSDLATTATAHISACDVQHRADLAVIAAQGAVLKTRPPNRNWHVGVGPSCSAIAVSGRVVSGCGLSAGYYWTPF